MVKKLYEKNYGKRPREELFDVMKDPDQMNNLAGNPNYQQTLNKLRNRLLNHLRESKDPRLVEKGKFFETPPLAGPLQGK